MRFSAHMSLGVYWVGAGSGSDVVPGHVAMPAWACSELPAAGRLGPFRIGASNAPSTQERVINGWM